MATGYADSYRRSLEDPEYFWAEAAAEIDWDRSWDRVLDDSNVPFYRWFSGGLLNTCYNALDRHVDGGRGAQPALIYDSAMTGTVERISYSELRDRVALCAGALAAENVVKGDRVIIYMPMIPEAVIAMLACARLGAVHSVVFGGFAARELAVRIDDAAPKVIISASCGLEPGRVIAGNAGILVTQVVYVKEGATRTFVIVDAAMNDLMRPSLYEAYHAIVPVAEPSADAELTEVDIVGPICETGDTFGAKRPMPALKAGDLLTIRTAGAYGAVMAGTYNSRPLVPEILVRNDKFTVVRRRQSVDDMLAMEALPNWAD